MSEQTNDRKHVFLVDGSGFIFRAFHALPPMNRDDGTPTNAVFGFTNMLIKLIEDLKADHCAIIFDTARKTFRNDVYKEYKANRPPPPDELVPQFAIIREAVLAFNIACIELEGYEADDLIATYTRLAREQGADVTIVSSDKDLMQLVGPNIKMFDPMKSKDIGVEDVIEKLHTSASLVIQENADPDVLDDLNNFFDKLVPMDNKLYKHTTEGKDDMPAHIKSALTNNQLTLSLKNKKLMLGTWQGLYLFEHRLQEHTRTLSHHLIGK